MSAVSGEKLTASQENYLEAILSLVTEGRVARVRDIADRLGVAMSSVTGALKGLAKRGLVNYSPHEFITLSGRGRATGERIAVRHRILRRFLTDVLEVDADLAEANACRIEHAVDDAVMRRLRRFVEFVCQDASARDWLGAFRLACGSADAQAEGGKENDSMTLAEMKPGQKAKIVRLSGAAVTNRRLVDMGLTQGAAVSVVRVAPLGDPLEITARGYHLSLRRQEAEGIEVEGVE